MDSAYKFYAEFGCGYFGRFIKRNPEFDNEEFFQFVIAKNKADRDSGELHDIAKHEILRLAYEWIERQWRFPNVNKRDGDWNR
jgi:hypothetical protein